MSISKKIKEKISGASWIRRMFEEGQKLRAEHGDEKVYDFTLGNPFPEPPKDFKEALVEVAQDPRPRLHGYMTNAGYPHVRQAIARYLSDEHQVDFTENEILVTCGAAGAINITFKTLLDPGDEVLCPLPYFVEYGFYADNHGGVLKTVPTHSDFSLNIDAIAKAITPQTKVMLINSPNNPTGQIYSAESLQALGELLSQKSQEYGRTIYLVSDEPYRDIVYDGAKVPSLMQCYPESIMATSYSKMLSIPGERIGFMAINPNAAHKQDIFTGCVLCNRVLGFVNAPAIMQRVIGKIQGKKVDVSIYQKKRDLLCDGLADAGYDVTKPPGAFYLFIKTPIEDDVEFVNALKEELVLTVPGVAFGAPGHLRISYCVGDDAIRNAMPAFKNVLEKYRG